MQCNDRIDNDGDGKIDYPNDPGCSSIADNNETDEACNEYWKCSTWQACVNRVQKRDCTDLYGCGTELLKPEETKKCNVTEVTEPKKSTTATKAPIAKAAETSPFPIKQYIIASLIGVVVLAAIFGLFLKLKKKKKAKRKNR
jgi:hypothetical protein